MCNLEVLCFLDIKYNTGVSLVPVNFCRVVKRAHDDVASLVGGSVAAKLYKQYPVLHIPHLHGHT